ncbi:MAG: plastocyanin/azurin family copper-binding protein [Acidimicrobiia bacterium]
MTRRIKILAFTLLMMAGMTLALPALAATKTVKLTTDNKFSPASLSISVGDTVQFDWEGGFHDVTFADGVKSGSPTADTGVLFSRTFNEAGTFNYVCTVHEALGMKGTITVAAASGGATTTTVAGSGGSSSGSSNTGSNGTRSMPSTGPEDSIVPIAGAIMVLLGAAGLVVVKRLEQ